MRTDTPQSVFLSRYEPYPFDIASVFLDFQLHPTATRVVSKLDVSRKEGMSGALVLDGEALDLISLKLDGAIVPADQYELSETHLTLRDLPDQFTLEIETEIAPKENTALSGLYISGGRYCTQCEAEGFRRITFWPDRPDVLSVYTVRAHTDDDEAFPYILSNGNPVAIGETEGRGHWAEWHDPFPKPSYLFALCAGDYQVLSDRFTTQSGRSVALNIYVDKGDAPRAEYAMDSLKRAMKWDEDVFDREYDLDVFNIVAVRDFNFGAMENKGLNIFNSAYILADAETATDADFEAIESIVAHEYFHNWTGNRITCRDWFQLCLKEGLTVYRDQEFSADMRSRSVQRIKDVIRLRGRQFQEDSGPLAHSVRPHSYAKIDNLYTATVYEKGAELIRSLAHLLGADGFAKGMALYFDRFDGTAATIEDFYACFEEATGRDLTPYLTWYAQAGTPHVDANWQAGAKSGDMQLSLTQITPATPGQTDKKPVPIPLKLAVLGETGAALPHTLIGETEAREESLITLTDEQQAFTIQTDSAGAIPILSINRGFSAPIKLDRLHETEQDLLDRVPLETDPFSQWDGLQSLLTRNLLQLAYDVRSGSMPELPSQLVDAVATAATSAWDRDPAYAALLLRLPTVNELFQDMRPADPHALSLARTLLGRQLSLKLSAQMEACLSTPPETPFNPSADAAGRRALRAACIELFAYRGQETENELLAGFSASTNMTETMAILRALSVTAGPAFETALETFRSRWNEVPLVMDKWFAVQATSPHLTALDRVNRLIKDPDFEWTNPNRVRSVAASFAISNLVAFHAPNGDGYGFLAEVITRVDPLNPALSARLLTAFEQWKCLDTDQQTLAHQTLGHLASAGLSDNARDIVSRALDEKN